MIYLPYYVHTKTIPYTAEIFMLCQKSFFDQRNDLYRTSFQWRICDLVSDAF